MFFSYLFTFLLAAEEPNFIFLSDIEMLPYPDSYPGWGEIGIDKSPEGRIIAININGKKETFMKGLGVHATGQITYNLAQYTNSYDRFIGYLGIQADMVKGDVTFKIQTSNDKTNWEDEVVFTNIRVQEGKEFSCNIEGKKYLRIYVNDNGDQAADHGVLGYPRLLKKGYNLDVETYKKLLPVSEYDAIINSKSIDDVYNNNLKTVFLRELSARINDPIHLWFEMNKDPKLKACLDWIIDDSDALKLLIESGDTEDPLDVMKKLSTLYDAYKTDLQDPEDGETYKKMMIGMAVAYGSDLQASPIGAKGEINFLNCEFDFVERFAIYKELYQTKFIYKDQFKAFHMELIRNVMSTAVPNNEIRWLRGYTEDETPNDLNARFNAVRFMHYNLGDYNPRQPKYNDMNNAEQYISKYKLDKYNVPYGDGATRYWMQSETGGPCTAVSRMNQEIRRLHGIPSIGTFQPVHECPLFYFQNSDGKGMWDYTNNNDGWDKSFSDWYGNGQLIFRYKSILRWNDRIIARGKTNYQKLYSSTYIFAAQAALNEPEKYNKSLYMNLIARALRGNTAKELEALDKALEALPINLDTFDRIIEIYENNGKSSAEWKELAKRIIENLRYYPMATSDYVDVIKPHLDTLDKICVDILLEMTLEEGRSLKDGVIYQSIICRVISSKLLPDLNSVFATFSFTGPDANTIIINPKYKDTAFDIEYSFDNFATFEKTSQRRISLSEAQISQITAENGIKVRISGKKEARHIKISPKTPFNMNDFEFNDLENILIGNNPNLEYSLDKINFKPYKRTIAFDGNVDVHFRIGRHDNVLPSEIQTYKFTEETSADRYIKAKYIVSVKTGVPHQGSDRPENMLDGSMRTRWRTQWRPDGSDLTFIAEFNKPKNFSRVVYDTDTGADFVGRIKKLYIYVSDDDIEYKWVGNGDWPSQEGSRTAYLRSPTVGKFIKLHAVNTWGYPNDRDRYIRGRRFSFFGYGIEEEEEEETTTEMEEETTKEMEEETTPEKEEIETTPEKEEIETTPEKEEIETTQGKEEIETTTKDKEETTESNKESSTFNEGEENQGHGNTEENGVSGGAAAGIAIACIAIIAVLCVCGYIFIKKRKDSSDERNTIIGDVLLV